MTPHEWVRTHIQKSRVDPDNKRAGMIVNSRTFRCKVCQAKVTVYGGDGTISYSEAWYAYLGISEDCDETMVARILKR